MSEIHGSHEIKVSLVVFFDRIHRKTVATLLIKEPKHLPRIGDKVFLSSTATPYGESLIGMHRESKMVIAISVLSSGCKRTSLKSESASG
jgi:hypothetical protein